MTFMNVVLAGHDYLRVRAINLGCCCFNDLVGVFVSVDFLWFI